MDNRILVVDDSPTFRGIASITLEKAGNVVTQACDGLDACGYLENGNFELFVVDINMPRMNGVELIHKIREYSQYQETPIIVLSTEDDPSVMQKVKDQSVLYWLVKPFTPVELLDKVADIFK
ncbi:MAG: response regulator [Kordiimonadaceae bacterium]|nr:response regulator [Kordiimonadaceae bacterium]